VGGVFAGMMWLKVRGRSAWRLVRNREHIDSFTLRLLMARRGVTNGGTGRTLISFDGRRVVRSGLGKRCGTRLIYGRPMATTNLVVPPRGGAPARHPSGYSTWKRFRGSRSGHRVDSGACACGAGGAGGGKASLVEYMAREENGPGLRPLQEKRKDRRTQISGGCGSSHAEGPGARLPWNPKARTASQGLAL